MNGLKYFRLALLIGLVALVYEYVSFWKKGIEHQYWNNELGGIFVAAALAGGIALFILFVAGWWWGYPVFRFLSRTIHHVLAEQVPADLWDEETDHSLRVLPYAALLGVVTWIVYSYGSFSGWPDDVIFGTIANLIGALFYVPLFIRWIRIWNRAKRTSSIEGDTPSA